MKEETSNRNTGKAIRDAERALEAFKSVGANRFDVTFKSETSEYKKYHEDADLTVKLGRALQINETKNLSA